MSSLFDTLRIYFLATLQKLGFINKKATIILLGLDNAGKTTLQSVTITSIYIVIIYICIVIDTLSNDAVYARYKLKTNQIQQFLPTQRAKEETIVSFTYSDLHRMSIIPVLIQLIYALCLYIYEANGRIDITMLGFRWTSSS